MAKNEAPRVDGVGVTTRVDGVVTPTRVSTDEDCVFLATHVNHQILEDATVPHLDERIFLVYARR